MANANSAAGVDTFQVRDRHCWIDKIDSLGNLSFNGFKPIACMYNFEFGRKPTLL
jgi:hypothetical protein